MADSNAGGNNSSGAANNAEVQIPIPAPSKAEAAAAPETPAGKPFRWWAMVAVDVFFLIAGQTSATLLGRYYYTQGGRSKWISAFVRTAGFPILFFTLFFFPSKSPSSCTNTPMAKLAVIYIVLGLIIAADDMMYTGGLKYLPASTYSLICASQLAFNVVFSYVLNSQKVTPLIFNSVVLLTMSASLIGVSKESQGVTGVSGGKYLLGFVLTLGASCTYSLILALMQLTFETIIKKHTFSAVLNMQIYTALVATAASVVGLFASGEWRSLRGEMNAFRSGQFSYLMTLLWAAVSWQVANIGVLGLIFEVSALFSNVISTVSLPVIPFFAVVVFHDRMNGVKIVAMLIAIWGFISYLFQHYLDGKKAKKASSGDSVRGQEDVVAESDKSTSRADGTAAAAAAAAPLPPVSSQRLRWWAVVLANIVFVLGGQSVATLLGRIYYDQGGGSLWLATVVQSCGAPLAVPLLLYFRRPEASPVARPPLLKIAAIYAGLGVLLAGDNLMYSYALLYLPLSTYSLVCATQLCFNAVFSYFLNKERFTALVLNSVVLLTFSAALVGVSHSSEETNSSVPEGKFALGFVLALSASAAFALILSLMQLTFDTVLRSNAAHAVLELQLWSNAAASCVSVAGLFISGEWSSLTAEMDGYKKGEVAYGMTLAWTAISWQLATMGMVGLVATVSSLFTNVISTVGMPLSPIMAVIFLGDRMDGAKVIAMLIGIWGFLSYVYQHYLDDAKSKNTAGSADVTQTSEAKL
uniref:OSJNBb0016D16.5 protein n=1 Tax=Oryza sativa subsp. japonica TaxID=39947 RepID=Q7FAP0_ORYSJ|nr:OSJNBb0016D16.5 [Oryza sativa Japonica Group]